MVAKVQTVAFEGLKVTGIEVQVQMVPGLPSFTIVGLPDKAVAESRERVRSAIHALGLSLPIKRIVVNLAPADILKEGSHFDLPIALALLVSMAVIPQDGLDGMIALGELSLDGRILPAAGVLPTAVQALSEGHGLICPQVCGGEAAWSGLLDIVAPDSLLALVNHVKGTQVLNPPEPKISIEKVRGADMREIRGQLAARRALEVAAAGAHNLLMSGPPGAGKSMLASCLPGILPAMDAKEILEASMVASIAGQFTDGRLSQRRPFRDPHHSSSMAAMVGGGKRALPGEISLAHHGVLFLDELPEFPRSVLESLRQPLEAGTISVARAQAHVTYPARFQLIAAMNPCRCGYVQDASRACNKAPRCAMDYQARISGPLYDRFDMTIEVPEVPTLEMLGAEIGESSEAVAMRVDEARQRQKARYAALNLPYRTNAELHGETLRELVNLDDRAMALLEDATHKLRLSMRGYTRVLRVARTVADLAASEQVSHVHVGEALSYRLLQFGNVSEVA